MSRFRRLARDQERLADVLKGFHLLAFTMPMWNLLSVLGSPLQVLEQLDRNPLEYHQSRHDLSRGPDFHLKRCASTEQSPLVSVPRNRRSSTEKRTLLRSSVDQ